MGDHIIRRGVVRSPARPVEPRPTAELSAQELRSLIRDRPSTDLEADLEVVDSLPETATGATPPRLAHTLRREPLIAIGSDAALVPPFADALSDDDAAMAIEDRDEVSTIAMPRLERPASRATELLGPAFLASETERTRELRNDLAGAPRASVVVLDAEPAVASTDAAPAVASAEPPVAVTDAEPPIAEPGPGAESPVAEAAAGTEPPAVPSTGPLVTIPAGLPVSSPEPRRPVIAPRPLEGMPALERPPAVVEPKRPMAPGNGRAQLLLPLALLIAALVAGSIWLAL
jgi:hypothetical protein